MSSSLEDVCGEDAPLVRAGALLKFTAFFCMAGEGSIATVLKPLWAVITAKDYANQHSTADVVVTLLCGGVAAARPLPDPGWPIAGFDRFTVVTDPDQIPDKVWRVLAENALLGENT